MLDRIGHSVESVELAIFIVQTFERNLLLARDDKHVLRVCRYESEILMLLTMVFDHLFAETLDTDKFTHDMTDADTHFRTLSRAATAFV